MVGRDIITNRTADPSKLRISLDVFNTISDKYREAVTSLNSDIPEMERDVNAGGRGGGVKSIISNQRS